MNETQPYDVDWIDMGRGPEIAKVEFPFAVKQPIEDEEAFHARAERDFSIIMRFVVKFVTKKGVSEAVASDIVKQLKLHVTRTSGWARAFINNISKELAEPVLAELYEQCVGNLPAQWRDGGLDPNTDEAPRPRKVKQPKQLELLGGNANPPRKKLVQDHTKPLCIAVPNPKFFTA